MKIITHAFFDVMELQKIIEKQNFYNNVYGILRDQYIEKVINFASTHDATRKNIYYIAKHIYDNSLHDNYYEKDDIQNTMKYIFDACVITYFTIYEKEVKKA